MIIRGVLYEHIETGTEGFIWCLIEDGKTNFWDSLNVIEEGDRLTIYDNDGLVIFDDIIQVDYEAGRQGALGFRIHWTQKNWKPDDWAMLFMAENFGKKPYRAELIKKSITSDLK